MALSEERALAEVLPCCYVLIDNQSHCLALLSAPRLEASECEQREPHSRCCRLVGDWWRDVDGVCLSVLHCPEQSCLESKQLLARIIKHARVYPEVDVEAAPAPCSSNGEVCAAGEVGERGVEAEAE